jgi:CPA2 family monovalent cation:H+ antiporter-2
VSESDYAHEALAEVVPLRDIFAILFFVSIGMLTQPSFVVDHVALLAAVISVIVAAKFLISSGLTWAFGYSAKTTLLVGASVFQIGEFSFVLARVGVDRQVLSDTVYQAILASAIISMLLTPLALLVASQGYFRLLAPRFPRLALRRSDPGLDGARALEISNHVVICGHGRVGRELSHVLERRNLSFVVIDLDPRVIAQVRDRGCPAIYGDCANREVLALAQLPRARVLVITVPDPIAIERATAHAREINPRLDIVVRLHGESDISLLRDIGATELVQPEFEAGMEVVRHTLARYGLTGPEIQFIIATMRGERRERGEL